jgi:hypothetical protein
MKEISYTRIVVSKSVTWSTPPTPVLSEKIETSIVYRISDDEDSEYRKDGIFDFTLNMSETVEQMLTRVENEIKAIEGIL